MANTMASSSFDAGASRLGLTQYLNPFYELQLLAGLSTKDGCWRVLGHIEEEISLDFRCDAL